MISSPSTPEDPGEHGYRGDFGAGRPHSAPRYDRVHPALPRNSRGRSASPAPSVAASVASFSTTSSRRPFSEYGDEVRRLSSVRLELTEAKRKYDEQISLAVEATWLGRLIWRCFLAWQQWLHELSARRLADGLRLVTAALDRAVEVNDLEGIGAAKQDLAALTRLHVVGPAQSAPDDEIPERVHSEAGNDQGAPPEPTAQEQQLMSVLQRSAVKMKQMQVQIQTQAEAVRQRADANRAEHAEATAKLTQQRHAPHPFWVYVHTRAPRPLHAPRRAAPRRALVPPP